MGIIPMSSMKCVIVQKVGNYIMDCDIVSSMKFVIMQKKLGIVYVLKILSIPKYLKKLFLKLAQYVLLEHIPCHA